LRCIPSLIPVDKERPDLGPDEMVGAAGSQMSQFCRGMRIDELEDFRDVSKAANHALFARDGAAEKGHEFYGNCLTLLMRLVFRATKRWAAFPGSMGLDELTELVNDSDGIEIRFALGVAPGEETVATQHHAIAARNLLHCAIEHHGQLKTRPLPREPHHLVAELLVELIHFFFAIS
jgi:hypothetical protein